MTDSEPGLSLPLVQASLLGEAIENATAAVFVADDDMRYLAVNRHACELLGYTRAELLALSVPDVARYASAAPEYREVVRAGIREGVARLTRKDGTTIEFRYRATRTTVAGMPVFVSIGSEERPG